MGCALFQYTQLHTYAQGFDRFYAFIRTATLSSPPPVRVFCVGSILVQFTQARGCFVHGELTYVKAHKHALLITRLSLDSRSSSQMCSLAGGLMQI